MVSDQGIAEEVRGSFGRSRRISGSLTPSLRHTKCLQQSVPQTTETSPLCFSANSLLSGHGTGKTSLPHKNVFWLKERWATEEEFGGRYSFLGVYRGFLSITVWKELECPRRATCKAALLPVPLGIWFDDVRNASMGKGAARLYFLLLFPGLIALRAPLSESLLARSCSWEKSPSVNALPSFSYLCYSNNFCTS